MADPLRINGYTGNIMTSSDNFARLIREAVAKNVIDEAIAAQWYRKPLTQKNMQALKNHVSLETKDFEKFLKFPKQNSGNKNGKSDVADFYDYALQNEALLIIRLGKKQAELKKLNEITSSTQIVTEQIEALRDGIVFWKALAKVSKPGNENYDCDCNIDIIIAKYRNVATNSSLTPPLIY